MIGSLAAFLLLVACGDDDAETDGGTSSAQGTTSSSQEPTSSSSPTDTGGAGCDPMAPFGTPVALTELNTSDDEEMPRLTPDELTVVFVRNKTLLYATRSSVSDPFGPAEAPPGFDEEADAWSPWLSPDGLTLYFSLVSEVSDPSILVARRNSLADDFGAPVDAGLDAGGLEWHPFLNPDQSEIWFVTETVGVAAQIWRAPVAGDGTIGVAAAVPDLAGNFIDWAPVISADGLEIFFGRGASGNYDIYSARRPTTADPFGAAAPVTELINEGGLNRDLPGWLSPDRCRLYSSVGGSAQDLYYADR
jgi:hypothetical protein